MKGSCVIRESEALHTTKSDASWNLRYFKWFIVENSVWTLKCTYLFSFFNWVNTFILFIVYISLNLCQREQEEKADSVCIYVSLFFFFSSILEISSSASFCSRAPLLLALQKFDLTLETAILRTLCLYKFHAAWYFI